MLTLKSPIQLHIAQGLTGNAEGFSERIRGNYGLLGAHYTPKDLLYLLSAPAELPEDMGGMTTLVNQQSSVNVRSVTLDVVNNVVNRILLDGSNQFTYQDQVYITSVLNRLGIQNVEQFMAQVRQLRMENESTVQLTRLYREELAHILERQANGEQGPVLPLSLGKTEEDRQPGQDPRVSMSLSILQRLDTNRLYETVHRFQRNWTMGVNQFHQNEVQLAEQLRFSNTLSLTEVKQKIYQQPQIHMQHHLNQYETGLLLEVPRDEEGVISQAAVAALVNAVDCAVVEVLNRPQLLQEQWVHMEHAIWKTAENTLSRFESYHSQGPVYHRTLEAGEETFLNTYIQELREYQTLYQSMYPRAAEYGRAVGELPPSMIQMRHFTHVEEESQLLEEGDTYFRLTQEQRRTLERELLERQTAFREAKNEASDRPLSGDGAIPPEVELRHLTYVEEGDNILEENQPQVYLTKEQSRTLLRELAQSQPGERRELLNRLTREQSQTLLRELREQQMQILNEIKGDSDGGRTAGMDQPPEVELRHLHHVKEGDNVLEENQTQVHLTREQGRTLLRELLESQTSQVRYEREISAHREYIRQETIHRETQRQHELETREESVRERVTDTAPLSSRSLGRTEPPPGVNEPTPVALTPREAEEQAPEVLLEQMERIDRQNRTVLQNIQQTARTREAPVTSGPDLTRTMRDGLRALESPELVLRELYREGEQERAAQPAFSPREEALLKQADPATRALYERVLTYQRDPEGALARGLLRPANMGALQAELRGAEGEVPLEHLQQPKPVESQLLREQSEVLLEQVLHLPTQKKRVEPQPVTPPAAVKFVHKQAAPDVTEELLEQLQQQRTQSVIKTESKEEVNRQQVRQVDVTQTERQMVHQTTEDITELVNRTLARQMRTISDQVYRQMEKRLQSERSRRGRF